MSHKASAETNLSKRTDRYIMAVVGMVVVGLLLIGLFYSLSRQELKDITVVQQEIATHTVSEKNLAALNAFVNQHSTTIERIYDVFPTETTIIGVLEDLEATVQAVDPNAQIGFIEEQPVRANGEMQIRLQMNTTSSMSDYVSLLRTLEKNGYIIEVLDVDINTTNPAALQIKSVVRLYVNDPFTEPK